MIPVIFNRNEIWQKKEKKSMNPIFRDTIYNLVVDSFFLFSFFLYFFNGGAENKDLELQLTWKEIWSL